MNPWPTNRLPTLEWNLPSQSTNKNTIISYLVVLVSRLNPRRSPRMDGATVSSSRTCRRCREWMKNVNGKDPRARPQYAGAIIAFWLTEKLSLPLPRPLWIHDILECTYKGCLAGWPVSKERVIHAGMNCLRFANGQPTVWVQPVLLHGIYAFWTRTLWPLTWSMHDTTTTRRGGGNVFLR